MNITLQSVYKSINQSIIYQISNKNKSFTTLWNVRLVSAECGMSSMKIRAYRPLNFNGEMFLKQSMFGCKLTEMFTNVPGYKMYELDIPLEAIAPCSLKRTENPEVNL